MQYEHLRWRLYYGDSTIHTGEGDEDAFAAPTISVQIMKEAVDNPDNHRGYSLRHGCKYFCWERILIPGGIILPYGRWGGKQDDVGLHHYWCTHKGAQKVLVGIELHDDTYHAISKVADNDGCLCLVPCNHLIPAIGPIGV